MSLITNLIRLYQVDFSTKRMVFPLTGKVYITISESGRITTIEGYPIDEIQEMIKLI